MSKLREEMLAAGFYPQMRFDKDQHEKLMYLKLKPGKDERITVSGSVRIPTNKPFKSQNVTLKPVTGGVRFRLINRN